jgi:YbbR domain-containing protein
MSRRAEYTEAFRSVFIDNWPYKLLTLCFAVVTWALVQSQQVVEDRVRVRIEWTWPDGLVPVEAPLETTTVTVAGIQTLMRTVRPGDLVLPIDLTAAREGDATIDLAEHAIRGLPAELRVVAINPGTLRVQLDRVLKRRVKVDARIKGEPAEGYAVREVLVSPDRVDVSGPASVVRALESVSTADVDVTGTHEDADFDVGLSLARGGNLRLSKPGPVTVSVHVGSTMRSRMYTGVPVVVRGGRYTAEVTSVDVKVEGPEAAVSELRPDAVSVLVYVPDDFLEPVGDARMTGAAADGLRFEVLGVSAPLQVSSVSPDTIHVVAAPEVTP